MSAYVSAVFEKTLLTTSAQVRVVIRNRDDGSAPPPPTALYFPTDPNDLREFILAQYISDVGGEVFTRVMTLSDLSTYPILALDTVEDLTANFNTFPAVTIGDTIAITIDDPQYWTSAEYTETNPFTFTVANVLSNTQLQLNRPLPAFYNGFSWTIATGSRAGYAGVTRRNGSPNAGSYFRTDRYNYVKDTVVEVDNAVVAIKAQIQSLVNASAGANLADETVTVSSQV